MKIYFVACLCVACCKCSLYGKQSTCRNSNFPTSHNLLSCCEDYSTLFEQCVNYLECLYDFVKLQPLICFETTLILDYAFVHSDTRTYVLCIRTYVILTVKINNTNIFNYVDLRKKSMQNTFYIIIPIYSTIKIKRQFHDIFRKPLFFHHMDYGDVESKLKLMLLKKDDVSINSLLSHLRKINLHLEKKNTRFLTGDTMCCFDCELMPRLQHIRVAVPFKSWQSAPIVFIYLLRHNNMYQQMCIWFNRMIFCMLSKYFMDFQMPTDLRYLWRYMLHMYQLDAFTQSCPADQDIVNHYKQQQNLMLQNVKMKKHEELETPTFTTSIPVELDLQQDE
ncbi:hypothetical protein QTP88_009078 [Uroleucon formosanum]